MSRLRLPSARWRSLPRLAGRAGVAILPAVLLLAGPLAGEDEGPPAGFKRYHNRGRFPSLDDPQFVPAAEADLPLDAWVLGVVANGEARAYELNLLTQREVINDRFGEDPVAVVWCPISNTAMLFDRRVDGQELEFDASGVLMHGAMVMQDRQTDSYWPILHAEARYGELDGRQLSKLPGAVKVRYADWLREHPETLVWSLHGNEQLGRTAMARYLLSSKGFRGMEAEDARLPTKALVFAFELEGAHYAAAATDIEGGAVFTLPGNRWVFLQRSVHSELQEPTRAYLSAAGIERDGEAWREKATGARFDAAERRFVGEDTPAELSGYDTFWYVWSLTYPDTALLGR